MGNVFCPFRAIERGGKIGQGREGFALTGYEQMFSLITRAAYLPPPTPPPSRPAQASVLIHPAQHRDSGFYRGRHFSEHFFARIGDLRKQGSRNGRLGYIFGLQNAIAALAPRAAHITVDDPAGVFRKRTATAISFCRWCSVFIRLACVLVDSTLLVRGMGGAHGWLASAPPICRHVCTVRCRYPNASVYPALTGRAASRRLANRIRPLRAHFQQAVFIRKLLLVNEAQ